MLWSACPRDIHQQWQLNWGEPVTRLLQMTGTACQISEHKTNSDTSSEHVGHCHKVHENIFCQSTTRDPLSTGNLLGPEDTFIQSKCTTQPNITMEHKKWRRLLKATICTFLDFFKCKLFVSCRLVWWTELNTSRTLKTTYSLIVAWPRI
jgi:hypothetical protein